ncbi:MAG: hypothetical protein V4689_13195 [Verrucomicrobiota bacterium]
MKPTSRKKNRRPGFALIVTLSLMILLTVIAVGLLTLSSISLRSTSAGSAQARAQANARLGIQLALAELQMAAGDDRRVTANGSIIAGATQGNAVGVWKSWSPKFSKTPTTAAPSYSNIKTTNFVRWLVSGLEADLTKPDWVKGGAGAADQVDLFKPGSGGFALQGAKVNITGKDGSGAFAWAVSQEATKAKITVSGPEENQRVANDDLQAQPRPSLALATNTFPSPPTEDWNQRAARVLDFNQVKLDPDLGKGGTDSLASGEHFTTVGAGLLTNVVEGGLKTDLSLGFEMSDSSFEQTNWTSNGKTFANPFKSVAEKAFTTPSSYTGQRPIYRPLTSSGTVSIPRDFWPANVQFSFPVTAVPTFHSLRSFYRIPHHLYQTGDGLTVFEREADHRAGAAGSVPGGYYPPPSKTMDAIKTQLGIRPVLDRAMFLVSGGLSSDDELRFVITPFITLWNPYNVALEIEGATSYMWIDMPYSVKWDVYNAAGGLASSHGGGVADIMGYQFRNNNHGRSVDPYFFAAITADGQPISGTPTPIRFEPGEVRVFAPAQQTLTNYKIDGTVRQRTIFMRPVDNINQYTTKGGIAIPLYNPARSTNVVPRKLLSSESGQITFGTAANEDYPFFISLEDATRAKGTNPTAGGKTIAEILANGFTQTGEVTQFQSARVSHALLKKEPVPIGVLESYHRVAKTGTTAQVADLVYTGNPRQPWMNPFISNTTFKTGPQYQMRMRKLNTFNDLMQSSNGGRSAYYGATQFPGSGRDHLSFFEIPSAPMLSLAGFQHADLSMTSFAPANQFGNSWSSAYVARNRVAGNSGAVQPIDLSYVLNESLWDGWFFSGAAPTLTHSSRSGAATVWNNGIAATTQSVKSVLEDFLEDPLANPLRNPRMIPAGISGDKADLANTLAEPAGCLKIAGELMVDGAFNVNSTSVEAWTAVLAGLRGAEFLVGNTTKNTGTDTAFPRLRDPVGSANDNWQGYRVLTDAQIRTLATKIVEQVIQRGPFQSLSEFVNRRVSGDTLALKGALQTAIDGANLNTAAMQDTFAKTFYEAVCQANITPNNSGVGIPGYLTQADILKPLAPIITVRSDTFSIRSYGEARDAAGKIIATAWAEATVQRIPDFIDESDPSHTAIASLNAVNAKFGRRFKVVSFRYLPSAEIVSSNPTT